MTELMQLYLQNREEAEKKIKEMDASILMAELEDTLQFDMMKISTAEWARIPTSDSKLYFAITGEILERLHRLEEAERKARAGQNWADENGFAGHYDENGNAVVDFEPGTDRDFDRYSVEVQNGDGYYDTSGKFRRYSNGDDYDYDFFDIDD